MNRDNKGKFAKSGTLKWFILSVIIAGGMVGSAIWYQHKYPIVITNTITVDVSPQQYAQKIDSLEKDIVLQVEKCESAGFSNDFGLVTYDPRLGGKNDSAAMSYGNMQMKKATVVYYYKTLYNKVITGKEAILIALDTDKSRELAQAIMFSSRNLANDWLNCSNKLSLEAQIVAIKKIK